MSESAANLARPFDAGRPTFGQRARDWLLSEGAWWAASFVFHMLLVCTLMLIGAKTGSQSVDDAPSLQAAQTESPTPAQFDPSDKDVVTLVDPKNSILVPDQLTALDTPVASTMPAGMSLGGGRQNTDNGPDLGGLGPINVPSRFTGSGVSSSGPVSLGPGRGWGEHPGSGGGESGISSRSGRLKRVVSGLTGVTGQTEHAVTAALDWIARHQLSNGRWSLDGYQQQCKDSSCTGPGNVKADAAATALALLPFLAAGQTHAGRGRYQNTIHNGLYWLLSNQQRDGDLSAGSGQRMYSHGLCAIALCEAYGLTGDKVLGRAAQLAVDFIQAAQNKGTGGWRYQPGEEGDTSVVGWQVMALKSAQMASLQVNPAALEGAQRFLASCASGQAKGLFSYQPGGGPSPSMVAVGLLCGQYLHMKRDDPAMVEGTDYLLHNLPDNGRRDLYYWYYGTQVMHNLLGKDWDLWNRKMRHALVETQVKEGCAKGSWDPLQPAKDRLAEAGGRLVMTSLSALTLEVYYRYLPLYKLDVARP